MKRKLKKNIILLMSIILFFTMSTGSQAFFYNLNTGVNETKDFFSQQMLRAKNISGMCKIYNEEEIYYYKKDADGSYTKSMELSEVQLTRNQIKETLDSLNDGEYLVGEILNSATYYDQSNKEFCFKRSATSSNTDKLTKVIIIDYDDNYQFKSSLTSSKGAYKVKKIKETEEFYVSYDDTWIEAELNIACDANSINLDTSVLELKVGETAEVKYTVLPENALVKSVTVSYSDGIEINTDTSGVIKIKALSIGDAYIIVKLKNNTEITAKCDIKVVSDNPTNEELSSTKYLIDSNKKYISKIIPKTKISDFKANVTAKDDYNIYSKNDESITNEDTLIATGMKLKMNNKEYTIIVKGDIDGNGKISITDLVKMKLYSVHLQELDEIEKIAADLNGDSKITITDIVQLNLASVNIKPIE